MATTIAAFQASLPYKLDDFQIQACEHILDGANVLVAAPTSSGKTVAALFGIERALAHGRRAIYTAPIKALSNQKYAELSARYPSVGLATGDVSISPRSAVVVMTTEVLRNIIYCEPDALADLDVVVLDEVHYLGDRERGSVWEEIIIHLPPHVLLICLSATVSNADEFVGWLRTLRGPAQAVVSKERPVPLNYHQLVGDDHLRVVDLLAPDGHVLVKSPDLALRRHRLNHLAAITALDRAGLLPAIVFIFSRVGCDGAASRLARADLWLTTPSQRKALRAAADEVEAGLSKSDADTLGFRAWRHQFLRGIAAHHAGLLPAFKQAVEQQFAAGNLKVVFATETLALGINMPARTVLIESLVKWDGIRHAELTAGQFTQLTGRAGRRGIDLEGNAVIPAAEITDAALMAHFVHTASFPLRSSFAPNPNMVVNLIATLGLQRSRQALESSFAQFQTDGRVVELSRKLRRQDEAISSFPFEECEYGDAHEYCSLRDELRTLQRRTQRERLDLSQLRLGSVIQGRRGPLVITRINSRKGVIEVVDIEARRHEQRLQYHPETIGSIRLEKHTVAHNIVTRKRIASRLRTALASGRICAKNTSDPKVAALRQALSDHPVAQCPHREVHARQLRPVLVLERERDNLLRHIADSQGALTAVFDKLCALLASYGYLTSDYQAVTSEGMKLRRLYNEHDVLLARVLDGKLLTALDPAQFAAILSQFVYDARAEGSEAVSEAMNRALAGIDRLKGDLVRRQRELGLPTMRKLDGGAIGPIHAWACGASMSEALSFSKMSIGDLVRVCKLIVDLCQQLERIGDHHISALAHKAQEAIMRGVVTQ